MLRLGILWFAIYRDGGEVSGYSLSAMVIYYMLVPFLGFLNRVEISNEISREVKDGELSKHLVKPYGLWGRLFMEVLGKKVHVLLVVVPVYVVLTIGFVQALGFDLGLVGILGAILVSVFAFVLHFFLDLLISWLSFWVIDVWAFNHAKWITFSIFGGLYFPFELLPENITSIFEILPFKFFYYVPTSYIIGKSDVGSDLPGDLGLMFLWTLIFIAGGLTLWKLGLKKYGAVGN